MKKKAPVKPDVSNESILAKTGRDWDEWVQVIDGFGGEAMTHKQIAQKLQEDQLLETGLAGKDQNVGWWCQSVTVGYEKIKGRRLLGQSADAGFQVGVHKTIYRPVEEVWELLLAPAGLKVWLGDIPDLILEKKHAYATKGDTKGEIRSFKEGEMIRLTWQSLDTNGKSGHITTLQVRTASVGPGKTRLSFHHEKLASAAERERMRQHWQAVAAKLAEM
jgi:uncharacterized protein YndB with AHSA1/START domain